MTNIRSLRTALACLLAAGMTAATVGAADARATTSNLPIRDCYEQSAFFPIPREQAASYLPDGFEPHGSPAGEPSVINIYVASLVCGDEGKPDLEMVTTYVSVVPPERLAAEGGSEYYVIDTGAEGPLSKVLRKRLCLGDTLKEAEIDVTPQRVEPFGTARVAAPTTSVSSEFLSVQFQVTGQEDPTPRRAVARWFFGADGGSFFDAFYEMSDWGIGSSTSVFTQSYKGLSSVSPGFGVLSTEDVTFFPARGCST